MKQAWTIFNRLAVCGLVLATAAIAQAEQRTADVVRIKGSARYSTGGNMWQPLKVGTQLSAGAIVQTAQDSMVDIVISGGSGAQLHRPTYGEYISYNPTVHRDVIRMTGDTVLAIDRLTSTDTGTETITDTELDLRSGAMFGSVRKISSASVFEIKIPNGVAGIRGTWFWISALRYIRVWDGTVDVSVMGSSGTAEVVKVPAGFQYDIINNRVEAIPPGVERPTAMRGTR